MDVVHHDIEIALQLEPEPQLVGGGTLRVRTTRRTRDVRLHARQLHVASATLSEHSLPVQQKDDDLCVELPEIVDAGAELSIQLEWEGSTAGAVPKFRNDQVWAGYRASAWMPTNQDPAERATLSLRISAPEALEVAASGTAAAPRVADGRRREHAFRLDVPTPPFLYAFAAGRFQKAERFLDGLTLRAFGPPGQDLSDALAITETLYRLFVSRMGASFPGATYTQVFVRGDAAQEAAGMALLGESSLRELSLNPKDDWIFAHELAHQWFGWLVPCTDFGDFWLNEGFATYLAAVAKEERWGRAEYDAELEIWRARSAKARADGQNAPVSLSGPSARPYVPPKEAELQPRSITYFRGALVLHKLRMELGDVAFWSGIRRYVKHCAGSGARSADLRIALEEASGRDLKEFFNRWVYQPAAPL